MSSMFRGTLLDAPFCSPFSTPFLTLAPNPTTTPSLHYPSGSPSTATLQGRSCTGRLAEQSSLTGYEPKSLIEVSSEHIATNLPSRKGSLDTNFDDLATAVDASDMIDTTDVGLLTSPLFSQEHEVSAIPCSVSGFKTHASVERSRRDVGPFASFGKPLSKGERHRELESVQPSQMEKGKNSV